MTLVLPGAESAESKEREKPESSTADTGDGRERTDGEGSGQDGKENGWVGPRRPPQILAENELSTQSKSSLYHRPAYA